MTPPTFGAFFRARREAAGLGLRAFARAHDLHAPDLTEIEHGRSVPRSYDVLARYATALGLDEWPALRAQFFDLAAVHHGTLPADVIAEQPAPHVVLHEVMHFARTIAARHHRRRA